MTQRDGATKVAEALREAPPALDELARARMEKRLLDAARAPKAPRAKRTIHPAAWAGGSALLAAAAVLLIVRVVWPQPVQITIAPTIGVPLEVSEPSQLHVGHAEVELAAESAVRFESIEARDVRLALTRGAIDVAFHPVERGAEHLSIDTPSARVEVVGTEFRVEIEGATTHVTVTEGTVRVVPHDPGSEPMLVHAGESQSVTRTTAIASAEPVAADVDPASDEAIEQAAVDQAIAEEALAIEASAIDPDAIEIALPPPPRAAVATATEPVVPVDPALAPADEAMEIDLRVAELAPPPPAQVAPAIDELPVSWLMDHAMEALAAGNHRTGRRMLAEVVRRREAAPLSSRIEAQILIGESYQREGDVERAIAAFELAARLGRRRADGANAIFALARLYETHDRGAEARATYLRYLDYGRGPNVTLAMRYLCRHDPPGDLDCSGVRP